MNESKQADAAYVEQKTLKGYLDALVERFETPDFIAVDPISVAHRYTRKQDVEVAAFVAAMFAWGQRPTILAKASAFLALMGDSPYEFLVEHQEHDRARFTTFVHRTFQPTDALYFVDRLQRHYRQHDSLEDLFLRKHHPDSPDVEGALTGFHEAFFDVDYAPARTRKHVATPARKSSCKRLNMFLRWMVRPGDRGVDFGLWKGIGLHQLVVPLDLHVQRVAKSLGLLTRKPADWLAALELTDAVRQFNPVDPARYDFALFGLGVEERYGPR